MSSYALLQAMSGIRADYVLEAEDFLDLREEIRKPRRVNRRLWTTLLVAAVLLALFTMTAYAMGWFGLRQRMIELPAQPSPAAESAAPDASPVPTAQPQRWVSLNGYVDSPEYLANAEWLRFRDEYLASHPVSNDVSWMDGLDEETVDTCRFYGVYDPAMLEELNALAERYGLALHTRMVTPVSLEEFYRTAGTGAFLTKGDGNGYIYEDGSFMLDWNLDGQGSIITILKNLSGTILPYMSGIDKPENYREWEYTTAHGDTVLLALNESREDIAAGRADLRIFYDRDEVFVMVCDGFYRAGSVTEADCEAVADRILFRELVKTAPDLDAGYREPTVCADPGDAATLENFLASPEGQAARAWSQAARSRQGTEAGLRELAALRPGIVERYGLTDSVRYMDVTSQSNVNAGGFEDAPYPPISFEDFAALGYEELLALQFSGFEYWDNGVMMGRFNHIEWIYIPFGAFCDYGYDLTAESYPDVWFYRTRSGTVVQLCADLVRSRTGPAVICRTEKGWLIGRGYSCHNAEELETWADEIDYTLFP